MFGSRLVTALAGLLFGLAVSVAAWVYLDTFLFFLFVPFVPFLLPRRRRSADARASNEPRRCPACGFETREPSFEFCPRDGTRLR